ncbi:MAG: microcin C transport system permease protein [bacterium]|jgi:microcin C transport system permease protein
MLSPIIKQRIQKFIGIKRGSISFLILFIIILGSIPPITEMMIGNKAIVVRYNQQWFFPFISDFKPGKTFGLDYEYEANYRQLQDQFTENKNHNWILMPPIPFSALENDITLSSLPAPPSWKTKHLLGTDANGRDILARVVYGFRIAIFFSFSLYVITTGLGIFFGCLMGYFGGLFDLFFQRIVEIWATLPSLYLIIILAALVTPNAILLILIFAFVEWTDMTTLMRAEMYREKSRQYCEAARSMGASHLRIIFKHLLPNSLVPIIAKFPFRMVHGIGALTGLDYLGYGLPIPTPSWGELLQKGQQSFEYAPWILLSPSIATIIVLTLFTFVGEAVREAFDPKQLSRYE